MADKIKVLRASTWTCPQQPDLAWIEDSEEREDRSGVLGSPDNMLLSNSLACGEDLCIQKTQNSDRHIVRPQKLLVVSCIVRIQFRCCNKSHIIVT